MAAKRKCAILVVVVERGTDRKVADNWLSMSTRQTKLIEILSEEGRLDVRPLAERFGVSEMTIRRDLKLLQEHGFIARTHGGGIPTGKLRFLQQAFPHYEVTGEKAAIGKTAALLVEPGQTVLIESGTTALEVARNLPRNSNLTVATTSLCVLQELYGTPMQLLLFGGYVRPDFPSLYGPMTEAMLKSFHVNTLFIGCDGADSSSGFYTSNLLISSLEQEMIRIADRVIIVTESSKFGRKGFVRFATPDQVQTIVTDTRLSTADKKNLAERGVDVVVADPDRADQDPIKTHVVPKAGERSELPSPVESGPRAGSIDREKDS